MIQCQLCSYKTENEFKFSKHIQHTHKLTKSNYIIQIQHNGVNPLCGCGCGENTKYDPSKLSFSRFVHGHQSRLKGHWGDLKSEKRVNAIKKTRKEKFASGEYNHILEKAKIGRQQSNFGEKISKGAKGIAKPKPEGFGVGRTHTQETKDKMSKTAIENILKTGKVKRSNLEYKFESILELENIKYIHSYYVKDTNFNKVYDFYLPDYKILIEVDGDFWHCNPNTKFANPECKSQELNIINDKIKDNWAFNNGYKLLRFWESDINNNIKQVRDILLENCI